MLPFYWISTSTKRKKETMFALLLFILFFSAFAFWNFLWKRRGLPPGPTPLPFLGNILAMRDPYEPFLRWTREYGPIYTVWLGEEPVVMVAEYEMMRDLFVKEGDAYAGRHFMVDLFAQFRDIKGKLGGVVFCEGEHWKVTRRFGLQAMRNLGMGRTGAERNFLTDMSKMMDRLRADVLVNGREEVNLRQHIHRLIGSTINRLLFGYAFDDEQLDEFYELKEKMDEQLRLMSSVTGKMLMTKPWLRHLPIFSATFAAMDDNVHSIMAFLKRPMEARMVEREKLGTREEPADLLDHFLDQIEATKVDPVQSKCFNLDSLSQFCFDLFFAGQETTSSTLGFLVLYMLLDQSTQARVHAELDRLEVEKCRNGFGNMVTLADKQKLPFLNAVINESQRLCNLLPINLSHRTMRDVQILGGRFKLKKGTIIVPQISCVLFDEKLFPNPERFEPDRFLNGQEQLKRCEELIPFSLGKRTCMGESLARMELFLFTANFFRHFQVLPVDPLHPPTAEKGHGFGVEAQAYNCRLVVREKRID